jgi:hypothetical protein
MKRLVTALAVFTFLYAATAQGSEYPDIPFDLTPELFGSTNYRPGHFVVHLHCGDGEATGKLLTRKNNVVQGLDTDPGKSGRRKPPDALERSVGEPA